MHDVKRKPNSPPGHLGAAATGTALAKATEHAPVDVSPIHTGQSKSSGVRSRTSLEIPSAQNNRNFQTKIPVITGEVHYKGTLNVEGVLSGQLGASGGTLGVRQICTPIRKSGPELSGEISFRDMVRVNGHIAGTVHSETGTLIIDVSATVDADIEVGVAIINGTVNGDLVAHERVEIGSSAKIYGNIWTRSIEIKTGAIFEGICTMLAEERVIG